MKPFFSDEARARLSAARELRVTTDDTRRKMSLVHTGIHPTEETKLKLSEGKRGEKNPMFGTVSPTRLVFADLQEMRRLRIDEGFTLQRLADHYGTCLSTIHNWLRKYEIKLAGERPFDGRGRMRAWNYKGGATSGSGYTLIEAHDHPCKNRGGYVPEHRLVIEAAIGRLLYSEERVHHLNFAKTQNPEGNLLLLPSSSDHQLFHVWLGLIGAYTLGHADTLPESFRCKSPMFYRGAWIEEIKCEIIERRLTLAG